MNYEKQTYVNNKKIIVEFVFSGYAYGPSNNEYNTRTPNQYETQYDGNVRYNNNPNNRYDRNYENQQYRQTNQETTLSPREIRKKLRQQFEYDQRTTYTNYQQKKRLTYGYELPMPYWETKYLRLFWDENGESIEFHMRYNLTYPGFWISSGPENGGRKQLFITFSLAFL